MVETGNFQTGLTPGTQFPQAQAVPAGSPSSGKYLQHTTVVVRMTTGSARVVKWSTGSATPRGADTHFDHPGQTAPSSSRELPARPKLGCSPLLSSRADAANAPTPTRLIR